MTKTLETAIKRLMALPEAEQEFLAQLLLDEMESDDAQWNASTVKHGDKLDRFADEVLAADSRGECEPLDPESL